MIVNAPFFLYIYMKIEILASFGKEKENYKIKF